MNIVSGTTGVIVADDDPVIRGILRGKLAAIGQEVFLACDGEEAVALASRMRAAMVILDLEMPRLNGLEACQAIRKLPAHSKTPIVILTAHDGQDAEDAASRVGATAFLTKPFRAAALLEVLARFLPMDATTLRTIQGDAHRATRIAQGSALARARASTTSAPGNALDRSKNILAVLRG